MGGIFKMDSPLMVFLTKVADLLILNVITLLLCIPVITTGASLTAMFSVLLKMIRKEEPSVVKAFMASFKENFLQSTIIWLIMLVVYAFIGFDIYLFLKDTEGTMFPQILRVGLLTVTVVLSFVSVYVFPLQCRFRNPIGKTIKNALFVSISSFPKTIAIIAIYVIAVLIYSSFIQIFPLVILLGITVPAYFAAMIIQTIFRKFEPANQEDDGEYHPLSIFEEEIKEKQTALAANETPDEAKNCVTDEITEQNTQTSQVDE